jgi:hypothetical protein
VNNPKGGKAKGTADAVTDASLSHDAPLSAWTLEDDDVEERHERKAIRKIMSMKKDDYLAAMDEAYRYLINAMGDGQMHHIKNCRKGDSHAVWTKLLSQFERNTTSNRMHILKKLFNAKLPSGGEASKFIDHIDEQTRILEGMDFKLQDPCKLCALLCGLPPEFAHIVTHIECKEKATYQFACERIIDFEQKIKQDKAPKSTASVERTFYNDISQMKCYNCNKPGHISKDCKQRRKNTGRLGGNRNECKVCGLRNHRSQDCRFKDRTCTYCSRKGHLAKACFKRKKEQANTATYEAQATFPVFHTTHQETTNHLSNILADIDRRNISHPSFNNSRVHHALMMRTEDQRTTTEPASDWIIDSGVTKHMAYNPGDFMDTHQIPAVAVKTAGSESFEIETVGTIRLNVQIKDKATAVDLENVLQVPQLRTNLFSIAAVDDKGMTSVFRNGTFYVMDESDGNNILLEGKRRGNLFYINTLPKDAQVAPMKKPDVKIDKLWHQRYAHIGDAAFNKLIDKSLVKGIPPRAKVKHNDDASPVCTACAQSKIKTKSFPKKANPLAGPYDKVNAEVCTDLMGKITPPSHKGYNHAQVFIDLKTKYVAAALLTYKSEATRNIMQYCKWAETQQGSSIKRIRGDGAGELTGKTIQEFARKHGIEIRASAKGSSAQNGSAERTIRTVTTKTRCLLIHASLDSIFWGEAFLTAAYLTNLSPSYGSTTPEESWSHTKPDVSHLKIFGCLAYVQTEVQRSKKFAPRGVPMLFLGYAHRQERGRKAYHFYDWNTGKFWVRRTAIFDETSFPGRTQDVCKRLKSQHKQQALEFEQPSNTFNDQESKHEKSPALAVSDPDSKDECQTPLRVRSVGPCPHSVFTKAPGHTEIANEHTNDTINEPQLEAPSQSIIDLTADKQEAKVKTALDTKESKTKLNDEKTPAVQRRQSTRENLGKPSSKFADYLFTGLVHHALMLTGEADPATLEEAIRRPDKRKWQQAVITELKALEDNKTWEAVVEVPKGRKIIKTKWIFKRKIGKNGQITRHKARLVVLGFMQIFELDFKETYAPVAKFKTIRLVLALAASLDLEIDQMDVESAFLQSLLRDGVEIYIEIPEGMQTTAKYLKLRKSLYGLKQAPREWYITLRTFLESQGFTQSKADECLFIKQDADGLLIVVIYVDDIIIASNNKIAKTKLKEELCKRFKMKDLGELEWFLGLRITRDRQRKTITLDQQVYIEKVISHFKFDEAKTARTPAEVGQKLMKATDKDEELDKPYRSLVGSLLYAAVGTRPDIAFATGAVCRFMARPTEQHWKAATRILRYLKKTTELGITFTGSSIPAELQGLTGYGYSPTNAGDPGVTLVGFADSDWANDVNTRRSVGGYIFMLSNGPIAWRSKLQGSVAKSTAEAEYVSAADAATEAIWLRQVMSDIDLKQRNPTIIYEDNQGCIALSKNAVKHQRTKHIDIVHHFVRERTQRNELKLLYLPTKLMIADPLTKALSSPLFLKHRDKLLGTPKNSEEL